MSAGGELNLDGLVGPTHHYAGLSKGNIASTSHAYQVANPAAAALQGIEKMRFLHRLGIPQGLLPPQQRPNLALLHQLGFKGKPEAQLKAAQRASPKILTACYSASSMWTANAATITPSVDSEDGLLHLTAANLISQMHRQQEADFSHHILKRIFHDAQYFKHHAPLPRSNATSDEGAANHNRICQHHHTPGLHLFVYGRVAFDSGKNANPTQFPARQTLEASQAIARLHQIPSEQVVFAQQNPIAIDQGVFHHDVIGVTNESVMLIHEEALCDQNQILATLRAKADYPLQIIVIPSDVFSVQDAVNSYLFNSQIITCPTPDHAMILIAPLECETHPRVKPWIDALIEDQDNPIQKVHYFDLKQSMQNGGGPACLRLRIPMTSNELQAMHQPILMTEERLDQLAAWVNRHYRDRLHPDDLIDPQLIDETYRALDELTQWLKLGALYDFQQDI